jgi:acetylornithine deacetylase/succinyl-diaminopimelate desuccinylase-like protein
MVNQSRIVALTQKLIRTNSENPGNTEKAVAEIVKKELEQCGFEVKKIGRAHV